MAHTLTSFGLLLRHHRTAAGLTQEELAEQAGLSVRGISDLERGERGRPHRDTVQMLADALGLTDEDRTLFAAAARVRLPVDAVMPAYAPPTNLPIPPTPLIGRAEDAAAVTRLLARAEVRIVNLTGPGGVGKTRLGLHVATDVRSDFPDGVFFIALATIHDPNLVIPTIGRTLAVQDVSDHPFYERVVGFLKQKRILLVLDNFEHVLVAAPLIANLLAACPGIKMLVTSRAALHLSGEHEFAVPPLAVPDRVRLPDVEILGRYPAVHLFLQRAQAVRADFTITDANAATIAEICARLDGLPLAIELAAARIKLLPPQAILDRLHHPLDVLTGGARDLPTRQQTLRDTIAWSHDLLEPREQILFRRLAVFVSGWTIEAAEAIRALGADESMNTLEELASLLDKNLIRTMEPTGDEPRFTMPETIREYAAERLVESGEDAATQRRHAEFFLNFAEQAEAHLFGADQAIWFARLEWEHGNVRAALQWAMERRESEIGAQLAGSLAWFWLTRGYLSEGRSWLEKMLATNASLADVVRAKALLGIGMMAWAQGDYGQAAPWCEESLALFRRTGDRRGTALALNYVARVALERTDYDRTVTACEEAIRIFTEIADAWGVFFTDAMLRRVAWARGAYDEAVAALEENLGKLRALGDRRGIGFYLSYLSGIALDRGDCVRAETLAEESLASFQAIGDKRGTGYALIFLAGATREMGNDTRAMALYRECLTLLREFGPRVEIAWALEGYALLLLAHGDAARAFRIISAATTIRETIDAPLPPVWQTTMTHRLAPARARIGEEGYATAWKTGRAMSLEQAITEALESRPDED